MVSQEKYREIIVRLRESVVKFEEEEAKKAAQEALSLGINAYDAIMEGLAAGMEEVGRLYEEKEYFVPEMLMCADALYAGLEVLKPQVKKEDQIIKGQVVIGTVQGDVHDIGKNLVKLMFEAAGFVVHDLGKDVPLEKFAQEQMRTDSEIVALSAMMTTTMMGMKRVIEQIRAKNPNVAIMVGGAPITSKVAEIFGADGYAENAGNAVQEAIKMISRLRELHQKRTAEKAGPSFEDSVHE
jgi:corrinoid protein of di/trimethylamine methyltransferase